jgi:hypothetical protein
MGNGLPLGKLGWGKAPAGLMARSLTTDQRAEWILWNAAAGFNGPQSYAFPG